MNSDYRPGNRRRRSRRRPFYDKESKQRQTQKKENPIVAFFKRLFTGGKKPPLNGRDGQRDRSRGQERESGRRSGPPSDRRQIPETKYAGGTTQAATAETETRKVPALLEVTTPRLYVGNLSYDISDSELFELFSQIAAVRNVEIARDRESHRSKGFGFVEMESLESAKMAQQKLNGYELMGRQLVVSGSKSSGERRSRT